MHLYLNYLLLVVGVVGIGVVLSVVALDVIFAGLVDSVTFTSEMIYIIVRVNFPNNLEIELNQTDICTWIIPKYLALPNILICRFYVFHKEYRLGILNHRSSVNLRSLGLFCKELNILLRHLWWCSIAPDYLVADLRIKKRTRNKSESLNYEIFNPRYMAHNTTSYLSLLL